MGDTFDLHQALAAGARSAVIVGCGYSGLEMAEGFTSRGLAVTLARTSSQVVASMVSGWPRSALCPKGILLSLSWDDESSGAPGRTRTCSLLFRRCLSSHTVPER